VDAAGVRLVEEKGQSLRVKLAEGLPEATARIPIGKGSLTG
jgi:hypothetical protein